METTNWLPCSDLEYSLVGWYLYVLEGKLEGKGLIVVGVEGALLDGGLLLPDPLAVLHQRHLHVGV